MTAWVLGASSQIGYFLLPRLRAAGIDAVALSRQPRADGPGLTWLRGELPDRVPALPPVDAVISFAPIDALAAWLDANAPAGLRHVVATSSMSAESKREAHDPLERATAERLRRGEVALAAACARRGIGWTVLRPTLIYGAGMDKSLTPIARRASRLRLFPLPAGRGMRQPVHADDIAAAAVAALQATAANGRIIPVGGGERLTAARMFARVRQSMAARTLPVPVPRAVLALVHACWPRTRGPISRLDADLVADNSQLEAILGVHPRAFLADGGRWTPP
jgi:nucleoside-diphosphate-sugar epimerase